MKLFAFLLLSMTPLLAQDAPNPQDPKLDPMVARELIRQWVKTERIISDEKTSWQAEKKQMQDLLDLYQKELKLLNEELSKAGGAAGMVDHQKETWDKELKEYRDAQNLLRETMARLLPRMRRLFVFLPEPLLDRVTADVDVLKAPDALEKPRDVLKAMLSVLAESGRFNRTVTVVEETHMLPDGKKMTVEVVYFGLARAYYASKSGSTACVGVPGKNGWVWEARPELADDIRKAISVYHKDSQPQLIKLPISLKHSTSSH